MAVEISANKIEQRIYLVRGRQVMLDSDLADLYEVETRVLNQVVRRNEKRFPGDDFTFRLNLEEYNSLRSQIVILENDKSPLISNSSFSGDSLRSQFVILENDENPLISKNLPSGGSLKSQTVSLERGKGNHRKFLPTVFIESGAIMLSGILRSDRAIEINVAVVKAFVEFRRRLKPRSSHEERMDQLERKFDEMDLKQNQRSQDLLLAIEQLRLQMYIRPPQIPDSSFLENKTEKTKDENATLGRAINDTVETIKKEVAHCYNIKVQDLKSVTRVRAISLPRQIAIYLIRKHTQLAFRDIGKVFGGKDHTTAMHAFQKIKSSITQDEAIRESVATIEKRCRKTIKLNF